MAAREMDMLQQQRNSDRLLVERVDRKKQGEQEESKVSITSQQTVDPLVVRVAFCRYMPESV